MASSDLTWLLVRKTNRFIVKRSGIVMSTEPNNLTGRHSFAASGLANTKSVGLVGGDNGAVLTLGSTKRSNANKPAAANKSAKLNRDFRKAARQIKKATAGYRNDLTQAALARLTALRRVQKNKAAKKE